MSCYLIGSGSPEGDAKLYAENLKRDAQKAADLMLKDLQEINELLCMTCRFNEINGHSLPAPVQKWWEEHKNIDAKKS